MKCSDSPEVALIALGYNFSCPFPSRASGHVDRFADLMVKDVKNGNCFRLDHLIKAHLEKLASEKGATSELKAECADIVVKLDGMTKDEMGNILKKFSIKAPLTNNELTEPIEFNLMFATQIGPSGLVKGYVPLSEALVGFLLQYIGLSCPAST